MPDVGSPIPILALAAVALIAAAVLVHALARRFVLQRELVRSVGAVPRDADSGLFDRTTCVPRIEAELARARRTGGSTWVAIVAVAGGDQQRVARLVADSLRHPEFGFRLAERVMCVVRPDAQEATDAQLIGRLRAAAPKAEVVIGTASWRVGDPPIDAAGMLHAATPGGEPAATTARPSGPR